MATKVTFKPRKGETLYFTRRNGEIGQGKFVRTLDLGKGAWYELKVEGMRNPVAKIRPSEARRTEN